MEGVVILHETINEVNTKRLNGVILKLDFEKAYDKVKWSCVQQTLRMKGFCPRWCKWIENFISGGSVGIKVNDDIGQYFQTKKRVLDKETPCFLSYSVSWHIWSPY
jgi:hypothetical protein